MPFLESSGNPDSPQSWANGGLLTTFEFYTRSRPDLHVMFIPLYTDARPADFVCVLPLPLSDSSFCPPTSTKGQINPLSLPSQPRRILRRCIASSCKGCLYYQAHTSIEKFFFRGPPFGTADAFLAPHCSVPYIRPLHVSYFVAISF